MESPTKYSILIYLARSTPIARMNEREKKKKKKKKNDIYTDKSIKERENLVIEFK